MLRIGLLGAGDISRYHVAAWRSVPDARLVAICDLDEHRATVRAAEAGGARVYTSAEAMFGGESLDAVDIATTRDTHVDMTLLAARYGVHVLCQKPLAGTLAEAAALVEAVDGHVRLMVNENRRFAPQYRRIRAWLDTGVLGTPLQALVSNSNSSMLLRDDGTRAATERASHFGREPRLLIAGALTHQLDVLRYLLGPLELAAALALRTEADIPGETVATLLLTTGSGAPVVLSGNSVAAGYADAPSGRAASGANGDRLEIIGSRSSCVLHQDKLDLFGSGTASVEFPFSAWYQACFDGAAAHFVHCLVSGAEFETSAADNLHTLSLVDRAYAAAGMAGS